LGEVSAHGVDVSPIFRIHDFICRGLVHQGVVRLWRLDDCSDVFRACVAFVSWVPDHCRDHVQTSTARSTLLRAFASILRFVLSQLEKWPESVDSLVIQLPCHIIQPGFNKLTAIDTEIVWIPCCPGDLHHRNDWTEAIVRSDVILAWDMEIGSIEEQWLREAVLFALASSHRHFWLNEEFLRQLEAAAPYEDPRPSLMRQLPELALFCQSWLS
jgi:hypothetical protein